MRQWGFRTAVAFAACLAVLAAQVKAEIATFDDLGVPSDKFTLLTLVDYKGLRWSGIDVVNGAHEFFDNLPGCGYRTGIVSGGYVAIMANRFSREAQISSPPGKWFDFRGVHLTAAWRNGLTVSLEGFRAGTRLYSEVVVVNTAQPTRFTFDFSGIDTLQIRSSGGVDAGICQEKACRPGPEVAMDNFSFVLAAMPSASASSTRSATKKAEAAAPPRPMKLAPEVLKKPLPQSTNVLAEVPKPLRAAPATEPDRDVCPNGPYHGVQVGAFRSLQNAKDLQKRIPAAYGAAQIHVKDREGTPFYRVVVGCMEQSASARELLKKLRDRGIQGFVVQVSKSTVGNQL
jgi:cell division septation protein DedD